MFVSNYVMNGRGHGPVGSKLEEIYFDTGLTRPYFDDNGRAVVTVNTGINGKGEPQYDVRPLRELVDNGIITNAPTSLRKDDWIALDRAVIKAARDRLRAWGDLAASGTYGGFNGMAKMVLEHETMSDPGEALVDMDAMTEGRTDSPLFQLEGLPLPITHSSFWFGQRRMAIARNSGMPLDTTMAEAAGRRVAEKIEQTVIGTVTGLRYGNTSEYGRTPKVYGYLNFPDRITKTDLTTPTGSNGPAVLTDVLEMRELMYQAKFYGPYMIYTSTDYDQYLDNLFSTTEPSAGTLRSRLLQIEGIRGIRRLDYLNATDNPFTMIMVQQTPEVARAVIGMNITTMSWESMGGLRNNYKVMAIMVPQLRADYYGNCGILHATTS